MVSPWQGAGARQTPPMDWEPFVIDGIGGWVAGDGPRAAVVLHGGPGLSDYMRPAAEEVLAGGDGALRVAHFQQRGLAPSGVDGPFTLDQFVDDVARVVDALGRGPVVLVGHSWGGHLAMHVAVRRPEMVAGLVLLDPLHGVGDGGAGRLMAVLASRIGDDARAALAALAGEDLHPDEALPRQLALLWPGYFADPTGAPPPPEIAFSSQAASAMNAAAGQLLAEGWLAERLGGITAPVVYQVGAHSPIDPTVGEATATLFPGAELEVLDCGHFAWLEKPGAVAAAVRRLLARL